MSALPPVLTRPPRPPVLDAARTALIPLRPLTIGEILDGAFLIVRRNIRLMLGLPLVVAGGAAAYALAGIGLWVLLGNTTARSAQIVLTVLMGLLGLLLLQQFLVWLTAILSRVSLQTVLGEGFAPATTRATWKASLPLFWPMLGLSLLQWFAVSVVQTLLGILYYVLTIGVVLAGVENETLAAAGLIGITVLTYALFVVIYGYLSLTVPALATESKNAPGWIGKPAKATNPLTAFERSVRLIGRNTMRIGLVYGGLLLICLAVIGLVAGGVVLMIALYASALDADVLTVLENGWTIFGVVAFSILVAMSVLLAYAAAVQTLVYLDLRMRREGLDLAMRFDCVPIPQPSAPPPVYHPWVGTGARHAAGMTPILLPLEVPVRIGRDEAQHRAAEELAKAKYGGTPQWLLDLADRADSVVSRLVELFLRIFGDRVGAGAGVNWGFVIVVLLLLAAVVLVVWRVGLPRWRGGRRDAAVDLDPTRAAEDYRTAAEQAAAGGDWARAVRDRFRAVVRELEVQTILDVRPARTASEAAYRASQALPSCTEALRAGAESFNAVVYGDRPATAATYQQLVVLDQQVAAAAARADLAADDAVAAG